MAVTTSCAAAISLARASGLVSLVSAITIRRSVPFCGSGEPNAAAPPLRRPGGAIAALDPAVVEQLARLCLVAEIALGHRGSAELQHPLVALAHLVAGIIH